jgi:hypothetical protein
MNVEAETMIARFVWAETSSRRCRDRPNSSRWNNLVAALKPIVMAAGRVKASRVSQEHTSLRTDSPAAPTIQMQR